jgi:hypothetical protein
MAKAVAMGALLCAALTACSPFGGVKAFPCATNEDCGAGGTCEADNLCSFIDGSCESGRRYGDLAGGQSNKCVGGSTGDDAPVDEPVIPPEANDVCFGATGALVEPCFSPGSVPAGAIALTADINTTNSPLCSAIVKGTADCVIAGGSITIGAGLTVNVTGSRALILLATSGSITIEGRLDAASHRIGGAIGPAANPAICNAGTLPATNGGGAGGSFAALGGNGGSGAAGAGGIAGAVNAVTLRGGCAGQNGDGNGGAPGAGGGAVYLIASTSISLVGAGSEINASGAGANGGANGSAGGGGGGSGGLIVLDAPTLGNAGTIFTKGGGGGNGSGSAGAGGDGLDPTAVAAGIGGSGSTGGPGGNGGTTDVGAPGVNDADRGGGGGGGGTGTIKLFGGAAATGTIVPSPT